MPIDELVVAVQHPDRLTRQSPNSTLQGGALPPPLENQVDMSKYVTNGEWDIINVTSQLNAIKYSCCPYLFYDVTFDINVRRKSLYYIVNLILPCALISALTLMKFFLPVESGEKIGLGVTALLAMTVFLLIVAETLPSSEDDLTEECPPDGT